MRSNRFAFFSLTLLTAAIPSRLFAAFPQFLALPEGYSISGYLKTLDFVKEENGAAKMLSGNRFRLEGAWHNAPETMDAKIISDHEFLYGSLLNSQRSSLNGNVREDELLQMQWILNEKENLIWRHLLYRAWAHAKMQDWDFTVGRQRMAWGQGRIWNPTDVINPYDPLTVEREERPGSDTLRVQWSPSALSYVEGIYVPKRSWEWSRSMMLGKAHANVFQTDWSVLGGKIGDEKMVGLDHASQWLDGSLRAELAYTFDSPVRRDFTRGVVSYDYNFSFSRPLYVVGEYFYNGIGEKDALDYLKIVLRSNDQKFLGRDYWGTGITWDATPLLKAECYGIVNLNDGSAFIGPRIKYQVASDWEIGAGCQIFEGKDRSEYGPLQNIGFAQVQWFFGSS